MKVIVVSHGDFAKGIVSTVKTFFGTDKMYFASVTQERGVEDLKDAVNTYLKEWGDEQVVICSDLKGGSANQTAVREWLKRENTFIISGTNLAVLLQLNCLNEITEESLRDIVVQARADLVLVNDLFGQTVSEEDDE